MALVFFKSGRGGSVMNLKKWINSSFALVLVASTFIAFQNYTAYNPEQALHVEVGYRRIAKVLALAKKVEIENYSKDKYDGCEVAGQAGDHRDSEKAYFCREYPFGITDLGTRYKTLTRSTVEYKDKETTRALKIHVKMSRKQNESVYQVKDLNTSKLETFQLSNDWRGRQRVQLIPKENNFYINACTYNPGFTIDIPSFDGKYTYASGWWGSASVKFSADPGGMSFDHLEVCGLVKVSMPDSLSEHSLKKIASNVKVELIALDSPKIINASFEKPKYKIKSSLVKFLIKLGDAIGLGVTKKINATISKHYAEYVPTPKELRDGTWLKKVPAGLLDKRIKANYKSMISSLSGSGGIEDRIIYSAVDVLQETCTQATKSLSHSFLRKLALEQCQAVIEDSDLKATPFLRNRSSESRGCYANSFDVNEGLTEKALQTKSWSAYTNQSWAGLGPVDDGCRLTGLALKGKFSQEMGNLLKCHVTYVNFKQNIPGYKIPATACEQEAVFFALSLLRLDRLESLKNRISQLIAQNPALIQRVNSALGVFINHFRNVVTVQDFDEVVSHALEESDLNNVGQLILEAAPSIKSELSSLKEEIKMSEDQILTMLILSQALKF